MQHFPVVNKTCRAVKVLLLCSALITAPSLFPALATAAEDGHGGGHSGGGSPGRGKHSGGGHDVDGHEDSDHGSGHQGSGRRGKSGHGAAGTGGRATESQVLRGRRPAWAGADFPEVELGRLNVSRAPARVLDHARLLAAEESPADPGSLYGLSAEAAAEKLATSFDAVERFHSPVQNLALYRELMTFGRIEFFDFEPASQLDLAAILLASAAERTKPISEDTVRALNIILGLVDLTPTETSLLASKAEAVRTGLDIGHGPEGEHTDEEDNDHGPGGDHGSDSDHGGGDDHGGEDDAHNA